MTRLFRLAALALMILAMAGFVTACDGESDLDVDLVTSGAEDGGESGGEETEAPEATDAPAPTEAPDSASGETESDDSSNTMTWLLVFALVAIVAIIGWAAGRGSSNQPPTETQTPPPPPPPPPPDTTYPE